MVEHRARSNVERLTLHVEPDERTVRRGDQDLAGVGIAVAPVCVRNRQRFVQTVEVGARKRSRFALVEGAAHTEIAIAEG